MKCFTNFSSILEYEKSEKYSNAFFPSKSTGPKNFCSISVEYRSPKKVVYCGGCEWKIIVKGSSRQYLKFYKQLKEEKKMPRARLELARPFNRSPGF
jgi:hypothetical protein